jgi:hypothetical protein
VSVRGLETKTVSGYAHFSYAEALAEFGRPRHLTESEGSILERPIPGTPYVDAMGCYPLFACRNWSQLLLDVDHIGDELVSLVLVTDPFGDYTEESLRHTFRDLVIPFKEHFVIDLKAHPETFVHPHHRRNARRSLDDVSVEKCGNLASSIDDWISLYANLIARHDIKGIAAFSNLSFAQQLQVPGAVLFKATYQGQVIGMTWWYVDQGVGYYHLGAYSDQGYKLRASFAVFWRAIEYFAGIGLRWLDIGAGAGIGIGSTAQSGLSRFKQGWSTGTRTAYFCGRIFNNVRYQEIMKAQLVAPTKYFPAYRAGEFA